MNNLSFKVPELSPKTEKQSQKTFVLAEPARFMAPDLQEHPCKEKPSVLYHTEQRGNTANLLFRAKG